MLEKVKAFKKHIQNNVSKVIVGKDDEIELLMVSFLAGGHLLLEDVPGMGKTMMIKAFSKSLNLPFKRIQFTPDLLPADITGIHFYNQKEGNFEFREGPIFANVVLTDEINRATPRTQSALLEAMEEKQISTDGETRILKRPFMVMATQNPIESYGTFPLPEAQMDRFLMRFKMGFPSLEEEKRILIKNITDPLESVEGAFDYAALEELTKVIEGISVSDDCMHYLVEVIQATRQRPEVTMKVSPRGSIALFRAAKARAALENRSYVIPEDIQKMAPFVLNHRMAIRGVHGVEETCRFIEEIVNSVQVPLENR